MLADFLVPRIEDAHADWIQAGRPGTFRGYLNRLDVTIVEILADAPQILIGLSTKTRKDLAEKVERPPRRLAEHILAPYIGSLTDAFLAQAEGGASLAEFIDRVRTSCPTEEALRAFLRTNQRKT